MRNNKYPFNKVDKICISIIVALGAILVVMLLTACGSRSKLSLQQDASPPTTVDTSADVIAESDVITVADTSPDTIAEADASPDAIAVLDAGVDTVFDLLAFATEIDTESIMDAIPGIDTENEPCGIGYTRVYYPPITDDSYYCKSPNVDGTHPAGAIPCGDGELLTWYGQGVVRCKPTA